ncbi:hypothetical protein APHAL10511_002799 [Amanita phalloides]|nr:hypothetical protein APHAL10511_002799 [Amanita phalloides]
MMCDEDETGHATCKRGQGHGIECDSTLLDDEEREDGSADALAWFDKQITNINAEIEKMAFLRKASKRLSTTLLQASADKHESERESGVKETIVIFPGVRGRVVDLCKPIQRKYETAVSVSLSRNIEAVVVDEKTAIDCIERTGQATFIPVDSIQVKPTNDKFCSFAKGAQLAIDVVPAVERDTSRLRECTRS